MRPPCPVMLRVTTGVHAGGHEYISTAHEDQKFGLSVAGGQAMAALEAVLARPELELRRHPLAHREPDPRPRRVRGRGRTVLQLRAELAARTGRLVEEVDLGGGYGVAYLPGEVPLDPDRVAGDVARAVATRARGWAPRRPGSRSSPAGPSWGRRRSRCTRWAPSSRCRRRRRPAHLRVGRRRDERQPRPALYGARYSAAVVVPHGRARRGAVTGRGQALRERGRRRARRRPPRGHRAPATCSPCP